LAQERIVQGDLAELYPRGVPTLSEHRWLFLVEQVIDGVMASIRRMPSPFLAYYHLFFPHEPYRPHRDFVGMFDDGWKPVTKQPHTLSSGDSQEVLNQYRVEYDEYLASVDAEFGRLYDFLEETGIADNTHIILTSDHGQLFERGVHGHVSELLYEPIIHVPLLIAKPGQQQRRDVHTPTSCVDLLPTLLGTVGYAIPDWCEGKVLPVSGAETGDEERSVFSLEAKLNATHRPLSKATVALIRGPYKLIHYFGYDGYNDEYELYDLDNDPEELDDLYSTKRSIAADLRHDLLKKLEEENSSMSKREAMGEDWQRLATLSNIYSEGGCRHG
jgi:arylsulfatase A-like enzyme